MKISDSDLKSETHIFTGKALGRRNILIVSLKPAKKKKKKVNNRCKILQCHLVDVTKPYLCSHFLPSSFGLFVLNVWLSERRKIFAVNADFEAWGLDNKLL